MRRRLALGCVAACCLLAACGPPTPTPAPSVAERASGPTTTPTPLLWTPTPAPVGPTTPTGDPDGDLGPTLRRLDRLGNALGLGGAASTATPAPR